MGALLGLAAALGYSVSDYVGGLAARRIHRPTRIQWSGLALGAVAVTAIVLG
jgi:hypothetical protein